MALAMPRGSGKTSIMSVAAIWAILYGYQKFIVIIGSSSSRAMELMEDIKVWIETNELLFEDFPEVCYPIRKLERITHRQRGQKYQGKPTRIDWAGNKLGFPVIDGSLSSGAVISASGMSGSDIRGQKALAPDGSVIRPDFILIDDPQTRETAASPTQCAKRESIISGDVLGMAGPGKKIAAFCACTVISQGDLADRMLDRKLHPEWHGERIKCSLKSLRIASYGNTPRYTETSSETMEMVASPTSFIGKTERRWTQAQKSTGKTGIYLTSYPHCKTQ